MPVYQELNKRWKDPILKQTVTEYLIGIWIDDYCHQLGSSQPDIVETSQTEFHYLFDIAHQRLIAAWGISKGKNSDPRDKIKSRMAGHPLSAGRVYHRGHAIAHTLGGGTDINLTPQLGTLNIGSFKSLEFKAVATPGALYFTYWIYPNSNTQTACKVEQGLLCPGVNALITLFDN